MRLHLQRRRRSDLVYQYCDQECLSRYGQLTLLTHLLFCVHLFCVRFVFFESHWAGKVVFGLRMLFMLDSPGFSLKESVISLVALDVGPGSIEERNNNYNKRVESQHLLMGINHD